MEHSILTQFGFDFNFSSIIQFMEYYLEVLSQYSNKNVRDQALQILTFQFVDDQMLNYSQSKIAACSVILAINIDQMEKMQLKTLTYQKKKVAYSNEFFKEQKHGSKSPSPLNKCATYQINTSAIWVRVFVFFKFVRCSVYHYY